ncbi:hypothetical protein T08_13505 [Trichinella sp. T8]|nr:hypothetical protein T08_13505 [Trichinella sp. T8]
MTHLATLSSAKSSDALKTDFQRCIMQITIAITLPYHQFKRMEQRKRETSSSERFKTWVGVFSLSQFFYYGGILDSFCNLVLLRAQ